MAEKRKLISTGTVGVDMKRNPLLLRRDRVQSAINIEFKDGVVKTRPGFEVHSLGYRNVFQGATAFNLGQGASAVPFVLPESSLAVIAGGQLWVNTFSPNGFAAAAGLGPVANVTEPAQVFQAENYLITQQADGSTYWWDGVGSPVASPGLSATDWDKKELETTLESSTRELVLDRDGCCYNTMDLCYHKAESEEEGFHSHDTFDFTKHLHFLANGANLGIYVHGRIHQEMPYAVLVSDLIHKRGHLQTDDILLMEEQMLESYGDPLSTNSKMGGLRAMAIRPAIGSPNGEGDLIAYYDNGVVAYNTFQFPRETRSTAEGETIQEGWEFKSMVSHVLNTVSAAGRYAVAVLPRDHVFRSPYGIHLLSSLAGTEVVNDEAVNVISEDVEPYMDADDPMYLKDVALGHWVGGHRVFASVNMCFDYSVSTAAFGQAVVSWSQRTAVSDEGTPLPAWEGLWTLPKGVTGVHKFETVYTPDNRPVFGAVASSCEGDVRFVEFSGERECDLVECLPKPIRWQITTRQESLNDLSVRKSVTDARVELMMRKGKVRVLVRTDETPAWDEVWSYEVSEDGDYYVSHVLGKGHRDRRDATWFQYRIEGEGYAEVRELEISLAKSTNKTTDRVIVKRLPENTDDIFNPVTD